MKRCLPRAPEDSAGATAPLPTIANLKWDLTPLGPLDRWSEPMRAAVDLLRLSPAPMVSFWGPTATAIFNPAFAGLVPDPLGSSARDGWAAFTDLVEAGFAGRSLSVVERRLVADPAAGLMRDRWLDLDGSPVVDRSGLVLGVLVLARDATGRVKDNRRSLARGSRDAARYEAGWVADPSGSITDLSPRWQALAGIRTGEGLGSDWIRSFHPEDRARTLQTWAAAVGSGRPYDIEHRMRTGDGSYRWMRSRAMARRGPTGLVLSWQGTTETLEHRKVVENRQALLLALADRFRSATERHDITTTATAALGREMGATRVLFAEIDLARHEAAVEAEWTDGSVDASRAVMPLAVLALGRATDFEAGMTIVGTQSESGLGGTGLAVPLIRDGRLRALLHIVSEVPRSWLPEEVALVEDVATRTWDALERVQATAILRRNQARQSFLLVLGDRLRDSVDTAEIMETTSEALGRQLHAHRAGYGEVGPDGTLLYPVSWTDGNVAPFAPTMPLASLGDRQVDELGRGLTTVFEASQSTGPKPPAIVRGLSTVVAVPLNRDGRLRGIVTLGRTDAHRWSADEIALIGEVAARMWEALERARAEAALIDLNATLELRVGQRTAELASSMARFRTLFENAPAAIFLVRVGPGEHAVFEAVNAATEQFTGRSATELIGGDVSEATRPDDPLLARCLECAAIGRPVRYEMNVEVGGESRTAETVLAPLSIESGDVQRLIGISHEITAQRRAEDQLRQAQKMEAIGQLTGGIAHDFNNLLTGIIGSLALMQKRLAAGRTDTIERYAGLAMTSANRAAALTHRLLAFSRRQPLDAKPVDLNKLVASMDELLRRTIGESTVLRTVETKALWLTLCDPHQLENALLNLAINGRDAMPEGGRLTIETANAILDDAYVAHEPGLEPGPYVVMSVTDTGLGMPPDVVARAFDPFFTTKPLGQGTGLGLSMIYGFVRQSGGHIKIYSEPGQGTSVKIFLPRFIGEDAEPVVEQPGVTPRAEEGETVLVVEDDATVRDLVLEVLRDLGYTALEEPDGLAGLVVLQSHRRIDLLVTDVGLPGMNGRQLAEQARLLRPELKVLFITGYAENAAFGNGHLDPGMQMMTKPFAVDVLGKRIRTMIGSI